MKIRTSLVASTVALTLALGACSSGAAGTQNAAASDFPKKGKPVTLLVSFAPGGAVDTAARTLAPKLEKALGTNVVVENKPGAGGQIGYTALTSAAADGYTIGATGSPSVVISPLDPSRGAKYTRASFAPLGRQVVDPSIVGVAPDSPYKTLKDLLEAAKAKPGTITASTTGLQTGEHLAIADIEKKSGAKFAIVHFSDGAAKATAAFLGGHVNVYVGSASDVTDLVKQGKIRVLGVASAEKAPNLPDVQTFKEQGYDVISETSRGYSAPAGVPADVKAKLEGALKTAINDPEVAKKMTDLGLTTKYLSASEYEADWAKQEETVKAILPDVLKK